MCSPVPHASRFLEMSYFSDALKEIRKKQVPCSFQRGNGGAMKIFLSWSGDLSREVASLLDENIRPLLWGNADVFMSKHDIASGQDWAKALAKELRQSVFGIVCLTPDNLQSHWLLYEAGALTSREQQRLCTLLLAGLEQKDVPSPLAHYQNRIFCKAEFEALMQDIRAGLDRGPTQKEFDEMFARLWPELWEKYQQILKQFPPAPRSRPAVKTFERTLLRLPLAEPLLAEMGAFVEDVRQKCVAHIRKLANQPGITSESVRANVFVPEYVLSRHGWACELAMHERLRRQMNRPQEWRIRFAPGQGATGTVFIECQQRIVKRRDFELTDEVRDAVEPDLKWMISTPITDSSGRALAVLNIDGLRYDCDNETVLQPVADLVSQEVKHLHATLDGCPKTIVTVQFSELQ